MYKFKKIKNSSLNSFIKAIPKKISKNNYKFLKKKKFIGIIIRTKEWTSRNDGSLRKFNENSTLIINKKFNINKVKTIGPTLIELYRKKYFFIFKNIF